MTTRVLMISGDKHMLVPGSSAYERYKLQEHQVEVLDVVVWPQNLLLKPLFMQGQYDVVTSQDPFWRGLLAWFVARRLGARLNVQVHTELTAQSFLRRQLSRVVLHHADSVRVVSEKIREQVVQLGIHAPIAVLPVFVDLARFRQVTPRIHAQKTILWIGRFEKEKDPLRAVAILKDVRNANVDAKLVMVGDGSMKREVEERARERSLELPVTIVPWQQDIRSYLEVADVVVCTSRHESWGASIVEALAAGIPVVAPEVGIAREAGAQVVERGEMSRKVVEVLKTGMRGELRLTMPTAQEWAQQWKHTL